MSGMAKVKAMLVDCERRLNTSEESRQAQSHVIFSSGTAKVKAMLADCERRLNTSEESRQAQSHVISSPAPAVATASSRRRRMAKSPC